MSMEDDAIADQEGPEDGFGGEALVTQSAALPGPLVALDRGILGVTKLSLGAIGLIFTGLICFEVASRYVFGYSLFFANALAQFLLLWFFLLGAGLALRLGSHVGFGLLASALPPKPRRAMAVVMQCLALVFFVQMAYAGIASLPNAATQINSALGISLFWGFLAVPVCFGLLCYHILVMLFLEIRSPDAPVADTPAAGAGS